LAASVAGPRAENRDSPWRVTDNPVFSGRKLLDRFDLRQIDEGIATLSQKGVAKPYASKFAARKRHILEKAWGSSGTRAAVGECRCRAGLREHLFFKRSSIIKSL
jgi:hypothetical protein